MANSGSPLAPLVLVAVAPHVAQLGLMHAEDCSRLGVPASSEGSPVRDMSPEGGEIEQWTE
eukprot:scaffold584898_cov18-Prasinocladus_malaysianus.AAC.2